MEQAKESIVPTYGGCGHLLLFSSIAVKEITSKFSILKQPFDFANNFVVQNSGRAQKVLAYGLTCCYSHMLAGALGI